MPWRKRQCVDMNCKGVLQEHNIGDNPDPTRSFVGCSWTVCPNHHETYLKDWGCMYCEEPLA